MAEQQAAQPAERAADGAVSTMSTPIFDELLREMTAQQGPAKQGQAKQGTAKQGTATQKESRHRAT